ncbi:MAG: hypothetical protein JRI68_14555 [Deltaproteobacteria bacterium]|nr:hypothetical protein [Deltaproteobacteria bacterium]
MGTGSLTLMWGSAAAGLALAFVACASGGGSKGEGGSGNTGAGLVGGQGGGGGFGGFGGFGGSGGQGGLPCEEDPCRLVAPQCGCPAGDRCTFAGGAKSCAPNGDKAKAEACENDCQAGMLCLDADQGAGSLCHQYCIDDEDCDAPGGLCLMSVTGLGPEKLCTHNCDPVSSAGCNDAGSKCDIYTLTADPNTKLTQCGGFGTGTQDSPCGDASDCTKGYTCVNNGTTTVCMQWCMVAQPTCSQGQCMPLNPTTMLGSVEYGVCVTT